MNWKRSWQTNEKTIYRTVTQKGDELIILWEGTYDECLAYAAGAHRNIDFDYVEIVDRVCRCGPLREERADPGDHVFEPRTGCVRCDNWDTRRTLRR